MKVRGHAPSSKLLVTDFFLQLNTELILITFKQGTKHSVLRTHLQSFSRLQTMDVYSHDNHSIGPVANHHLILVTRERVYTIDMYISAGGATFTQENG